MVIIQFNLPIGGETSNFIGGIFTPAVQNKAYLGGEWVFWLFR